MKPAINSRTCMRSLRTLAILFLGSCLLFSFHAVPPASHYPKNAQDKMGTHSAWTELLQRYVDSKGNVNYKDFQEALPELQGYLRQLGAAPPDSGFTEQQTLSYYINLYNAATVKLILDNYPLLSIRDLKNPWKRAWIQAGPELLSLDQIEHDILRKKGDPRIHFVLNCASRSCPRLGSEAYTAEKLESQLQKAAEEFIADPSRNRLGKETLWLSRIFDWYEKDFTGSGSLPEFLASYSSGAIDKKARIRYLPYDWSLNDTR